MTAPPSQGQPVTFSSTFASHAPPSVLRLGRLSHRSSTLPRTTFPGIHRPRWSRSRRCFVGVVALLLRCNLLIEFLWIAVPLRSSRSIGTRSSAIHPRDLFLLPRNSFIVRDVDG